jgi:hypothetical protein
MLEDQIIKLLLVAALVALAAYPTVCASLAVSRVFATTVRGGDKLANRARV